MSIDEAIDDFKKMAKDAINDIIDGDNLEPQEKHYNSQLELYAKEKEQIAQWLEELKALRHEANEWRKAGYSHGYNKAIDDFVKACKENIMYKTFGLRECDIEQIAEQLKERS